MSTIKPRIAKHVIYQGDDLAELAELDRAVSESPDDDAVKTKRDKFAAAAEKRGVVLVLHNLGRKAWRDLVKSCPPRKEGGEIVEEDAGLNMNMEAFMDALVPKSVSIPQSTLEGDLDEFLDSLSDYEYEQLFQKAFRLNRAGAEADPTRRLMSVSR